LAVDDVQLGVEADAPSTCVGEREEGPIFLNHDGSRRLDRDAATRIVERLARHAGIDRTVSPYLLRHSFITATLDAGMALRDVQEAASHDDPKTTMRFDRARRS
jgi:site-specific recombinase XerD